MTAKDALHGFDWVDWPQSTFLQGLEADAAQDWLAELFFFLEGGAESSS
jgi:hypothetical protein